MRCLRQNFSTEQAIDQRALKELLEDNNGRSILEDVQDRDNSVKRDILKSSLSGAKSK